MTTRSSMTEITELQASEDSILNPQRMVPSKRHFDETTDVQYSIDFNESQPCTSSLNSGDQQENQGKRKKQNHIPSSFPTKGDDSNDKTSKYCNPDKSTLASSNQDNDLIDSDVNDDNDINIESSSNFKFSDLLGELGQEAKMILLQYTQTFSDSELYEQQSIQAISDLTAHANVLEQRLQLQKELLCNRLKTISQNLKNET